MGLAHVLGRAMFGGFFLYSGIHHFQDVDSLEKYAGAKQVDNPRLAVELSGALLVASGASLLFGIEPELGAAGAALFLAPTTFKMHNFWTNPDPAARQNERIHFFKNLALLGGAIALYGLESAKTGRQDRN